ncbi:very-long-chain (3R)-3-hydroxyacyl-CoA dehydratase 1 [Tachysurus ichikawai]
MASGEEDGALEEKETNNKKRTKSIIATAWLMFYNIAMTAGYVRTETVTFTYKACSVQTAPLTARVAVYSFRTL